MNRVARIVIGAILISVIKRLLTRNPSPESEKEGDRLSAVSAGGPPPSMMWEMSGFSEGFAVGVFLSELREELMGQFDDIKAAVAAAKTEVADDIAKVSAKIDALQISQADKDALIADIQGFGTALDTLAGDIPDEPAPEPTPEPTPGGSEGLPTPGTEAPPA